MHSSVIACLIGILYVLVKMGLNYKESPSPNFKDGVLVMLCSVAVMYGSTQIGIVKPKVMEVFTETPGF
jgi:hypothetical protein